MATAYVPTSSVGWLDFDAAASERVATLLRSLEEPGTLDPLGLGSVRDAFSAMLSPGTSTIQTRLRYFVFVPWIFQRLESHRVAPAEFFRRLRDSEARLIDCLRGVGPDQGVIGYTAGRELKRMPSEIYWGGLGSWGIRKLDLTRAEYAKHAAALGRLRPDRDDDGNPTTAPVAMWAPMPAPPDDFLDAHLDFRLHREEAQVLIDHITQRHPDSLLAVLCNAPGLAENAELPWDLPLTTLPARQREVLHHARCFSELTIGPQRLYNVLLARKARAAFGWDTGDLEASQTAALRDWAALIGERQAELRAWVDDLDALWWLLAPFDTVRDRTRDFVTAMMKRAVEDPAAFADDEAIHVAIRVRESQLKGGRARLGSRSALESWNQVPFGGQLDYRWRTTRSYLSDLTAAMAEAD